MKYCADPYRYQRRKTRVVWVGKQGQGGVPVGGDNPVAVQSMLTCDTMNTELCIKDTLDLVAVGCQIVRITAPALKDAQNLKNIVAELRKRGCHVPIVADIHFKPDCAIEAAQWVEKVRVNPGNYADKKKFAVLEYTDAEYAAEIERIESAFKPLVQLCKQLGRAMRIGTNHGSLSDRIMNRYGDTPLGMVESALEFVRICRKYDYHEIVLSMKASNPKVMIEAYRLLVARMDALGEDWHYPIHLGVTEAGEGEDARIKSAIGIGSLLEDGIGDTIRVSLTEDSVHEIPVCKKLVKKFNDRSSGFRVQGSGLETPDTRDPFHYTRRPTPEISLNGTKLGAENTVRVFVTKQVWDKVAPKIRPKDDVKPEAIYEEAGVVEINPLENFQAPAAVKIVAVADGTPLGVIPAYRLLASKLDKLGAKNPILLKDVFVIPSTPPEPVDALLHAATMLGSLIADGIGDAILIRGEPGAGASLRLAYNILQAAGCRSFKTDYVACPSCGRTLFNLQTVTAKIKARTVHLKGVKIAIMGCIVNGPGEMADADFGYVGGAPNKINLYVGKNTVKFNIPEAEAVDRLVDLIREHGKWVDPEPSDEKSLLAVTK
ncbi:MAG: 4-hydroxy-3-methylbut-2-en-1-yl diphosphate synthase [Verrucomicrobiae bacterium]|nr:4-hydroxy-3-methylbut-2-en-1-yl diphosphate synthase [Verrucomicrobiae bacterium]